MKLLAVQFAQEQQEKKREFELREEGDDVKNRHKSVLKTLHKTKDISEDEDNNNRV